MRRHVTIAPIAWALPFVLLACSGPARQNTEPFQLLVPVAARGEVIFVERTTHTAFLLDLSTERASVRTVVVGSDPVSLFVRHGADEVVVLSRGKRGDTSGPSEPAALTVIPIDQAQPIRRYPLENPFNNVVQTDDGRFAFVSFVAADDLGRLLFNPNAIAVVDMSVPADAPASVVSRTVRSFGGVPTGVLFSPPLAINGSTRTLAVVLSSAYVTVIDLAHLDRSEITVRLTLADDTRQIHPAQIAWDSDDPTAYVRADADDDVYVLHFVPQMPAGTGQNDFVPSVNQLAVGHLPSDIALFGSGAGRRLLVVAPGSSEADVIDAPSNRVTSIALTAPANRILLFDGAAPRDPTSAQRAFLYTPDLSTSIVSFLDLADVEDRRSRNLEPLTLPANIAGALAIPGQPLVLFQHNSSAAGLSLVDLQQRTASPIVAEVPLASATFGIGQQRLWVGPAGSTRIGFIDLTTFIPGELLLDAPVETIVPLAGDPTPHQRIVAVHDSAAGSITVIDGDDPERMTAVSFQGFLYSELLSRGAP